ncbi:MAG: glycosyltransferase [Clostridia bacterium]|nr:glycosyltransferase [Clostridia bacterium]
MKKTVIYFGNFILPDCNAAAHRVVSVGKILREIGYNTVYLGIGDPDERFDGLRSVENSYGFDMFESAYPAGNIEWVKRLTDVSGIEQLIKKYQGVREIILYNAPYATVCAASKLAKKYNIKLLFDCTELCDVTEGSLAKRIIKKADAYFTKNSMPKKIDGLIVISSFMERFFEKFQKPMVRLTPLVDIGDPIWHGTPIKSAYKKSFCFAGTIDASKDFVNEIVKAFTQITDPDIGLDVVGVAEEDFKNKYPDILPAGGSKNITFFGRLSHAETIAHVLGADYYIFIRPSDLRNNAGFPTKFTEAATSGAPIITTNVSDIGDYIGKSIKGYIVSDTNAETIKKTVLKAAADFDPQEKADRELLAVFDYRSNVLKLADWIGELIISYALTQK